MKTTVSLLFVPIMLLCDNANAIDAEGAVSHFDAELAAPTPASGMDIDCQSQKYKFSRCFVGFYIRRAYLVEQYSRTTCIKGRNWDIEGIHIWVNDGCRGKFHADPDP